MSVGETGAQPIECPNCGARYRYPPSAFDTEGHVRCQNCAKLIGGVSAPFDVGEFSTLEPYGETVRTTSVPPTVSQEALRVRCPHCGAKYLYRMDQRNAEGSYRCQNCGREIAAEGERVTIYETRRAGQPSIVVAVVAVLVIALFFVPLYLLPIIVCLLIAMAPMLLRTESTDEAVVTESDQGLSIG
jgi:DNA-directed RNA polymerase subunit RPC12/RpoP